MASYGLKYLCEYRSKMRGRLLYRIEIEERDAVALTDATALRMRPYSDVFTLKWGSADDPEYTAVKGSALTLKILCVDDMEYLSLFSVDPLKFRVTIYEYRTDSSGAEQRLMLWRGFLSASSYKETFSRPPYVVTLSATDGFALLDSMPYLNAEASRYYGIASLQSILDECVSMLSLELPVSDWLSIDEVGGFDRSMKNIYLDRTRIYDIQADISWKKVLEMILKPFMGQIFQAQGCIYCRGINSLRGAFRPSFFYRNAMLLGQNRARVSYLWRDKCDLSNASELQLCAPYRAVAVSVENGRGSDTSRIFYDEAMWTVDRQTTRVMYVGYLKTRFVYYGYRQPVWMKFPYSIHIGSMSEISVSLRLSNMRPEDKLSANVVVIARSATSTMVWDNDAGHWIADRADYSPNVVVESSDMGNQSYLTDPASVPGEKIDISISESPELSDYDLLLRVYAYNGEQFTPTGFFAVSEISINAADNSDQAGLLSSVIPVSKTSMDECRVDVPIRDAGYHANMEAFLTCPILESNGLAVSSWLSARERGDLPNIISEDVMKLRSSVIRQIDGELRCPDSVDLNSIFVDDKFTKTKYYVNSIELHASRQVYGVQLRELRERELLSTSSLERLCSFAEPMQLSCSLYRSLFLVAGEDPCRVLIFDIDTAQIREMSLSGKGFKVRKGLGAVVVQSEEGFVYALDHVGNILSYINVAELPTDQIGQVEFDASAALYDADRKEWVSLVKNIYEKTAVVHMSEDLEIVSRVDLSIVASEILLISNGYVLQGSDGSSWWHNYELHPSEKIEALDDRVEAVSDSLLATRSFVGSRIYFEIRRRSGQLFEADMLSTSESIPAQTGLSADVICNCAVVAIRYMDVLRNHFVWYYDARTRKSGTLQFESAVDVALAADRIYILRGQELLGFRLDDVPKIDYWLRLDDYEQDITMANISGAGDDSIAVWVESNGTPYIVSQDSRLTAALIDRGNGLGCEIVVPANTSSVPITYDPVVIGIEEDDSVRRSITIEQQAN